jgi:hypothetical protein
MVGDLGTAKLNFAKLYKQCDVLNNLPSPALGIIRTSFPMAPHPIPLVTSTTLHETLQRQRSITIDTLQTICISFIIHVSTFGIMQTLSLPTLSIALPDLTSQPAVTAIARIKYYGIAAVAVYLTCPTGTVRGMHKRFASG